MKCFPFGFHNIIYDRNLTSCHIKIIPLVFFFFFFSLFVGGAVDTTHMSVIERPCPTLAIPWTYLRHVNLFVFSNNLITSFYANTPDGKNQSEYVSSLLCVWVCPYLIWFLVDYSSKYSSLSGVSSKHHSGFIFSLYTLPFKSSVG